MKSKGGIQRTWRHNKMITNFEQHTAPLTTSEVVLMNKIACFLRSEARKGREINNQQIDEHFSLPGQSCGSARIRKIINHIRIYGIVPRLLANSKGYYISNNRKEIDDYINSLHQRAGAILAIENAICKQKVTIPVVPSAPNVPINNNTGSGSAKPHQTKTQQTELFREEKYIPPWAQESIHLRGTDTGRL